MTSSLQFKDISFKDGLVIIDTLEGIKIQASIEHFEAMLYNSRSRTNRKLRFEDKECLGCKKSESSAP